MFIPQCDTHRQEVYAYLFTWLNKGAVKTWFLPGRLWERTEKFTGLDPETGIMKNLCIDQRKNLSDTAENVSAYHNGPKIRFSAKVN